MSYLAFFYHLLKEFAPTLNLKLSFIKYFYDIYDINLKLEGFIEASL